MKKLVQASALVTLLLPFSVFSQAVPGKLSQPEITTAVQVRQLALYMAKIKSSADLARHLRMVPLKSSPLGQLSDAGRKSFLSSLTFNASGLTGYRYADLEAELTPTQIFNVLALFGTQHNTPLFKNAKIKTRQDQLVSKVSYGTLGDEDWNDPIGGGSDPFDWGDWGDWGGGWGNWGIDPVYKDYEGYECAKAATCAVKNFNICKDNC